MAAVYDKNNHHVRVGDTVVYHETVWKVVEIKWFMEKVKLKQQDLIVKWIPSNKVQLRK